MEMRKRLKVGSLKGLLGDKQSGQWEGWQPKKHSDSPMTAVSGTKSHTHIHDLPKHQDAFLLLATYYACIPFNPAPAGAY